MLAENLESKVIIAGAGPGDVDLITVKAVNHLSKASYILVDRLVNPEIISRYANPKAKIIYVGKQGGKASIDQDTINSLLLDYAQRAGTTVRLKGGDVSIYSQLMAEIETLKENNIPYEIIPGITAASGAAASLGFPLTARSYSQGVRYLTYYSGSQSQELNWTDLAQTSDTLIFYMSSRSLPELVNKLVPHTRFDKPLAIVEQATTPREQIKISSLFRFEEELKGIPIKQPALIIIGDVISLYNKPNALNSITTSFFKEHSYAV